MMKNDAATRAGRAFGEMLNQSLDKISRYRAQQDAILDAYIRSGKTGRTYQEERDDIFRKHGWSMDD